MSAVEVTITGVLYDKLNRTTQQVVLIGEASLTGLGVGGGPIQPPGQPGGPVHIWGPPDMPPGFWGGGMGPGVKPQPHPEHPIVIPPPPEPVEPPIEWKAVWHPTEGWIVVGIPNLPHPAPSKT